MQFVVCRATTDFTGWPTPPTTPLSAEKILEMASRTTTTTTTTTTTEATTTTTTTTTTPQPTTPGICTSECQLAGTIRLTNGAQWVPELIDRNTAEYKSLAANITAEVSHTIKHSARILHKREARAKVEDLSYNAHVGDDFIISKCYGTDVSVLLRKQYALVHTQRRLALISFAATLTVINLRQLHHGMVRDCWNHTTCSFCLQLKSAYEKSDSLNKIFRNVWIDGFK